MTKPQHIQDPRTGRLAGSIGVGASDIPVEIVAPAVASPLTQTLAAASGIDHLWEAMAEGDGKSNGPDPVSNAPEDLEARLGDVSALGLQAANALMDLRDRYIDARSSFTTEDQARAQQLSAQIYELEVAISAAREQVRHATAFVEGEHIASSTPGATAVIAADLLSSEASDLSDTLLDKLDDDEGLDPELRANLVAASRHAAEARAVISNAIARVAQPAS